MSDDAMLDDEARFLDCLVEFERMERSPTFWQQLCNDTGRTTVRCLQETTSVSEQFWTDTDRGNLTFYKNVLAFGRYNGDFNMACEVETVQVCRNAWDCFTSVFSISSTFRHEGLLAFYSFYCGTIRGCLQYATDECPVTTDYLRKKKAIVFDDGKVLLFQDLENKLITNCAATDSLFLRNCLGEPAGDGNICQTSPLITNSESQCSYTGTTAACIEEKCGRDISGFFMTMFAFLRCGTLEAACETDVYGDIVFDAARAGTTVTVNCTFGQDGTLTRSCNADGNWEDVDDKCEWNLSDLSKRINDLKNAADLSDEEVGTVLKDVKAVTEPAKVKKPPLSDVRNLAEDITFIMEKKLVLKNEESSDFFDIISNTLDRPDDEWKTLIEKDDDGANTVIDNTDTILRKLQNQDCSTMQTDKEVQFKKTNLDVLIGKAADGIKFSATSSLGLETGEIKVQGETLRQQGLSAEACFGGVHYRKGASIISPRLSINGSVRAFDKRMFVNSDVISLQLDRPLTNVNPPVTISMKYQKANKLHPQCVYWDFSIQKADSVGAWSTEGCSVKESNGTTCVCQCSHLTNFAVLMSLRPQDPQHVLTLSFISAVGCFISMLGLLATIICHGLVWRWVRSDRAVLLMHFCCTLFVALGVFLAGINRTESKVACTVIAGVLHLLFLVVFFLMLLKGIEILLCVVRLFTVKFQLIPLLISAWLIPAVIVGISMVITLVVTKTDGFGTKDHCWLSTETGLIWAFVGPAAVVILINFCVIIIIFRTMATTTMLKGKSAKKQIITCVRSLCVLLPLTGCVWVFGVLSVNNDLVVFQYLFCILNSLQGVFVFIFHCVYNQQLRDALRRRKERKQSQSTLKTTLPKSKTDSMDGSKTDRSRKTARQSNSGRRPSRSSENQSTAFSPDGSFEQWEKGQRKQHQRDLRMQTSNHLDWTNV